MQAAWLNHLAIRAALGEEESFTTLRNGLQGNGDEQHDVEKLARLFGQTTEQIEAALAKGWRPPNVHETRR